MAASNGHAGQAAPASRQENFASRPQPVAESALTQVSCRLCWSTGAATSRSRGSLRLRRVKPNRTRPPSSASPPRWRRATGACPPATASGTGPGQRNERWQQPVLERLQPLEYLHDPGHIPRRQLPRERARERHRHLLLELLLESVQRRFQIGCSSARRSTTCRSTCLLCVVAHPHLIG